MLQTTALRNAEVHWVSNLEMILGSEENKQVYNNYRNRMRKFSLQGMWHQSQVQDPGRDHPDCVFAKKKLAFLLSEFLPSVMSYVSNTKFCLAFSFKKKKNPSFSSWNFNVNQLYFQARQHAIHWNNARFRVHTLITLTGVYYVNYF